MTDGIAPEVQVRLETKIAYQEKALSELNEALVDHAKALIDQQRRIEVLEKVVGSLSQQFQLAAERPHQEKPPHY